MGTFPFYINHENFAPQTIYDKKHVLRAVNKIILNDLEMTLNITLRM